MKENQKNGRRMDGRETEEKIIKCAGQLIAEKGFASVTSKEICRAAGVNLAAVNYHFGSRDGLYLAVLENVQQYLVGLQQLINLYESDLAPRQKMEKLIDFLAGNAFRKNEWQISDESFSHAGKNISKRSAPENLRHRENIFRIHRLYRR